MKPVAVFQHCHNVTPGHFASFLEARSIPWQLFDISRGDSPPADIDAFRGLCFMGGSMSVNDNLPWIPQSLGLIRQAVERGVPVIGHCLGGQLMTKALGGTVSRNPVKEIGWGEARACDVPEAREWLGDIQTLEVYQWHGETFSLPDGAVRILEGAFCRNQAYVLGPHLGMQFHVEMTEALIENWNMIWPDELAAELPGPSIQSPEQQAARTAEALPRMRALADRLYGKWIEGLRI